MHPFQPIHGENNLTPHDRSPDQPSPALIAGLAPTGQKPARRDVEPDQRAMDLIDEACMESFPCSDPPSYTRCHS